MEESMHILFDDANTSLQRKDSCDDEIEQILNSKSSNNDELESKEPVEDDQNDKEEELPCSTNIEIQDDSQPNVEELQIEEPQHQDIPQEWRYHRNHSKDDILDSPSQRMMTRAQLRRYFVQVHKGYAKEVQNGGYEKCWNSHELNN
ncbi:uncharacterized protein LOC131183314 [Hevea brasiliensis]|uniref:uncharacterized protein LOC131183314 n=1 Tax=Hevea brasiliensis TaxID=3981 RepID=UPI0025DDEFC5|nr:uncharacterized protein LOC131183314 [Hevea brasiliensis]